ncbi:hypothetical protein PsorP6_010564 [Peronosclerospora sorghi]|uniref:Uncharacterized protein n=1 Tax=Peronosclerospora sorghi TaxID=230839 RepID=A0ACC0VYY9_9STRA|nr:hypothetical protein PsorP6_010564 [Peronosclerospora sorghi]
MFRTKWGFGPLAGLLPPTVAVTVNGTASMRCLKSTCWMTAKTSSHVDRSTDDRRLYFIDLFFQVRYYSSRKGSRKNRDDKDALTQSWNAFVDNYNKSPDDYVNKVHVMRERFLKHSRTGKMEYIHFACIKEGLKCGVPSHLVCPRCTQGAPRLSEEELRGYGGFPYPPKFRA